MMYSPQALWTAARYRLNVLTVVLDNHEYRILKRALDLLEGAAAATGHYVAMDIADPALDFCALATSMGVAARRVDDPAGLEQAVNEALAADGPRLLHVPISGHAHGDPARARR
jgi:benzoylformate decarboxylase